MKIHYFCKSDLPTEEAEKQLSEHEIIIHNGPMQDFPNLRDDEAEILCVFVQSHVGAEELDRFPGVKLITTLSTGYDHIDLGETKKRGIAVANVPTYGENTVAEHAFALILTLSRKIYDAYKQIEEGGSFAQDKLRGFDLKGKTIGIVGAGNIGRHAVAMARGFSMNILVFDIHKDEDFAKEYDFKYVGLDELFANSDIIDLHVPYNKYTHHLINQKNLIKIKKGAYLINTSRGPVVETEALIVGLKDGIFAGAGLDVLEEEGVLMDDETKLLFEEHPNAELLKTTLGNHHLIDHPRVIITPHIAFNTDEAVMRILQTTINNIQAFANGNPENLVDL